MSNPPRDLAWPFIGPVGAQEDHHIFKIGRHQAQHPVTGAHKTFSVLHAPDWVNVIALTPADELLLVRQFRHGRQHVTLELPAGLVEPGERPEDAARRELAEETGFRGGRLIPLGAVEPNPAFQDNLSHTFLALDVEPGEVSFDPDEVLSLVRWPLAQVSTLLSQGEVTNAMILVAFFLWSQHAGGFQRPR